ncbi:enoyl-CoA hydratase/isomerase family protein [Nocardioides sp. zg-ZUI104]|uniref:enoyl-CoA hydratase/isomerase family protein n=1 Tax=Nocardioides faecalis TaxID=2803858 RepID=UPI001BCD3A6B|nr:enoyl-CoA hydratase-related protein [Nocardioides faecalis]MBS4752148.1 enoyl-CoA hydratase/isomerase family protein [Nocardioides faecalis]
MSGLRTSRPEAGVVLLQMHRPEHGNALDVELKTALRDTLAEVAADDTARAVVLAGNEQVFTVGQDLAELHEALRRDPARAGDTVAEHYNPITRLLVTMPKPVVAAVSGTCVGAGLGFALACDLQVWGEGTTLGTAFAKVGLTCDSGLSATLARSVGAARAARLVLLAETFPVEQGLEWGLAGDLVAPGEVLPTALALAGRLATGPTRSYAASKRLLADAGHRDLEASLAAEAAEQSVLGTTADHLEAVGSFLARRRPVFTGA